MLKFEKPDYKVKEYIKDNFYGKFELEPLERGFGTTIGNALRCYYFCKNRWCSS